MRDAATWQVYLHDSFEFEKLETGDGIGHDLGARSLVVGVGMRCPNPSIVLDADLDRLLDESLDHVGGQGDPALACHRFLWYRNNHLSISSSPVKSIGIYK